MRLEDQLAALAELGLTLAPGRTVDELLSASDRVIFEEGPPFESLLCVLGDRVHDVPTKLWFCDRVWHFDFECVGGPNDYLEIAEQLSRIAGRPGTLAGLRCDLDWDLDDPDNGGEGWIEYTVGGVERRWDIEVEGDWADAKVAAHLMGDLEHDGQVFYGMDNGQAVLLAFLDDTTASRLNDLAGEPLFSAALPTFGDW